MSRCPFPINPAAGSFIQVVIFKALIEFVRVTPGRFDNFNPGQKLELFSRPDNYSALNTTRERKKMFPARMGEGFLFFSGWITAAD